MISTVDVTLQGLLKCYVITTVVLPSDVPLSSTMSSWLANFALYVTSFNIQLVWYKTTGMCHLTPVYININNMPRKSVFTII